MEKASSKHRGKLMGRVRKDRITQMVHENGFMSSADLAEAFDVSEMTVRRDLAELEMRGEVRRTHGGAIAGDGGEPAADAVSEPVFDERQRRNSGAKQRIARAAAKLIQPGQITALDVGTTTFELGRLLVSDPSRRIFTNNLRIAALDAKAEVYLLGGRLRSNEKSLVGPVALEQARKLWFDLVFLGVSSISSNGIFDYSIEDTEIKKALIGRATTRVVLADSSKFDEISLVQIATLNQFDILVTDRAPEAALAADLAATGVKVIVAEGDG
ncbi:DeoR/GlpR family DNA-binding transcription regulator [Mangrovicoccus sp. HB161399]|uniref:DeoR/GlpR family DNA-binding transcription regulator n=1 Tax=Mangrovicoccus sp. HB161399 TaxID=2720392 RepID=UPI0015534C20|nr:DeoR/GlpR family DNA-binding transcription regulator [Mangrovicoccus sp. HB161399]